MKAKLTNLLGNMPSQDSDNSAPMGCDDTGLLFFNGVSVQIITIDGDIVKRTACADGSAQPGTCDLDDIDRQLVSALANPPDVVLLWFNSPGGNDLGLYSTAGLIEQLAQKTTVIAFSDTCMCSAAYLLACACPTIVTTPDSLVGSIGALMALVSVYRQNTENGVDIYVARSGKYKALALPVDEMTDLKKVKVDAKVKAAADRFWNYASSKRKLLPELRDADTYSFDDQIRTGLVDYQVGSWYELFGLNQ